MGRRVLIVNHTSRLGGAEKVLLTYLAAAKGGEFEFYLTAPDGDLLKQARKLGIQCCPLGATEMTTTRERLSLGDVLAAIGILRKVHKVAIQVDPHVILSNSVKAHVVSSIVARWTKGSHMIRLHDQISSFSRATKWLISGALRRARLVSCVSESVADDVRSELGSSNRVEVCYNGIVIDEGAASHMSKRIVVAGWMFPWKGFDVFIEAMDRIANELKEWQFVIAGGVASDVPDSQKFHQKLDQMLSQSIHKDKFIFHGSYNSLSELICCPEHSIFVLPSQRPDPLPTVILEAAFLGAPLVATSAGGAREIITDGITGILTGMDSESIAKAVLDLVSNLNKRCMMAKSLTLLVTSKFSVEAYVAEMSKQISKLVIS